jgi:antagonist of KipI
VIDQWLQNYSTNLQAKVGGFEGRSLKKNDRLSFKRNATYTFTDTQSECEIFPWAPKVSGLYIPDTIRFIHGAEYHLLDNRSQQELQSGMFKISSESNRMGYRLKGNGLSLQTSHELISTAVTLGTIQLLPGGQMIVLMADHQTTGGYPRVGHVISADISSLAQMQPGEEFHFQQTDIYTAEKLITAQEMNLQQLQNACNFRLHAHINQRR